MAQLIETIHELIQQIILALGYLGISFIMLVENLFPPIPSEVVMPFAGFLVAEGRMIFFGIVFAGTIGAALGATLIYYFGCWMGEERLLRWTRRYGRYVLIREEDIKKSMDFFERNGEAAVFIGRLIPGVRSLISIPAGLREMPLLTFLGLTLAGTVLWNIILAGAGVLLGRNWTAVLDFIDTYELVIWGLIAAGIVYLVIRRFYHPDRDER